MKKYKLTQTNFIQCGNSYIPPDLSNLDYQRFIQDVIEQGIEIVEGPDIIEPSYVELRQQEYPKYADQFDQIFHEGLDAWKETIQEIKDKYPKTITGGTTVGPVPDWVQEAADNWVYNQKLNKYIDALETLINFTLYDDRPELDDEEYLEYQKSLDIINKFIQEYLNS
jgi:hypothetical protein